jgi:hypothetical protein
MSALDRPSVELVEAVQMKLKEAASREQDGLASAVLTVTEIDALVKKPGKSAMTGGGAAA